MKAEWFPVLFGTFFAALGLTWRTACVCSARGCVRVHACAYNVNSQRVDSPVSKCCTSLNILDMQSEIGSSRGKFAVASCRLTYWMFFFCFYSSVGWIVLITLECHVSLDRPSLATWNILFMAFFFLNVVSTVYCKLEVMRENWIDCHIALQ